LMLPEVGLRGNSHFMFSDTNNIQVADLCLLSWTATGSTKDEPRDRGFISR